MKSSFSKNIVYSGLSKFIQIGFNFLILGFVVKCVGVENWGLLTYSLSIVTILSIVQLSISAAAAKRLTDFYYSEQLDLFNKYFSCTIFVTLLICTLLLALFAALSLFFYYNDRSPTTSSHSFLVVFIITGINSIFQILNLPFLSNLQAINRIDLISKISMYGNIFRIVLVFSAFSMFRSIEVYSMILCAECLLVLIMSAAATFKYSEFINVSLSGLDKGYIISTLSFNFYNLVNNLTYILFMQLPILVISNNFDAKLLGYYGIGIQLNSIFRQAVSVVVIPLTSLFNIDNSKSNFERLSANYNIFKYVFLMSSFIVLLNQAWILKLMQHYVHIEAEYADFMGNFIIFVAVSVMLIPASLLTVTFEKVKLTSFVGLFLALLSALCINYLSEDEFLVLPLIMGTFYFLYDLVRKITVEQYLKEKLGGLGTSLYLDYFWIVASLILTYILSMYWESHLIFFGLQLLFLCVYFSIHKKNFNIQNIKNLLLKNNF